MTLTQKKKLKKQKMYIYIYIDTHIDTYTRIYVYKEY